MGQPLQADPLGRLLDRVHGTGEREDRGHILEVPGDRMECGVAGDDRGQFGPPVQRAGGIHVNHCVVADLDPVLQEERLEAGCLVWIQQNEQLPASPDVILERRKFLLGEILARPGDHHDRGVGRDAGLPQQKELAGLVVGLLDQRADGVVPVLSAVGNGSFAVADHEVHDPLATPGHLDDCVGQLLLIQVHDLLFLECGLGQGRHLGGGRGWARSHGAGSLRRCALLFRRGHLGLQDHGAVLAHLVALGAAGIAVGIHELVPKIGGEIRVAPQQFLRAPPVLEGVGGGRAVERHGLHIRLQVLEKFGRLVGGRVALALAQVQPLVVGGGDELYQDQQGQQEQDGERHVQAVPGGATPQDGQD